MTTRDATSDSSLDRDNRLNEILLAYVEELEAGRQPDRERLISEYPELQAELKVFFDSRDEIDRLASPLRSLTGPGKVAEEDSQHSSWANAAGRSVPFQKGEAGTVELGQLGDFQLLREIGRGGMGVVYEAQQISLRRRVALKVLPFAAAIDHRQLQRFKNEALAAAHLQHANIVPVYAVGSDRGVHYYAMRIIAGQSLAELIRDLRDAEVQNSGQTRIGRSDGPVSEQTSMTSSFATRIARSHSDDGSELTVASVSRTVLMGRHGYYSTIARLGRQVALALEHAHQTGIVHRDIKPSNLLLDTTGQLWITDFGLAQMGGDVNLTVTGELVGTLRYSSPEQLQATRGIVDHRTDIYSLGATLYELATLRPMFEGKDRADLLRKIPVEEPVAPRSIDSTIPEDLETIILKAIRKEPSERYGTALDLADDLQRFLDSKPILASRPTLLERVRKWGRRHPSVALATASVLLLVTAGSMLSTALIQIEQSRTRLAKEEADSAYRRERQRAEEAELRFQLARRSVDELIRVSEEELTLRRGMESLRRRLLRSALNFYQEFLAESQHDPSAQAQLMDTKRRVEGILSDLAVLRSSMSMYLLAQGPVLDDLQLEGEQRKKMQTLAAQIGRQWYDAQRRTRNLPAAERTREAIARARVNQADIDALLTAEQKHRIEQISLQLDGIGAFQEPDVVSELDLTPNQRVLIREIEERYARRRLWSSSQSRSRTSNSPSGSSEASPMDQILKILDDRQLTRWQQMLGRPFTGVVTPFGPVNPSTLTRSST